MQLCSEDIQKKSTLLRLKDHHYILVLIKSGASDDSAFLHQICLNFYFLNLYISRGIALTGPCIFDLPLRSMSSSNLEVYWTAWFCSSFVMKQLL